MSGLNELYQEVILDHNRRPRNFGPLATATHRANGHNPLCGDRLTLALDVKDGVIADVKFEGNGCAISKASASLMTTIARGKLKMEVESLASRFHAMVTTDPSVPVDAAALDLYVSGRKYDTDTGGSNDDATIGMAGARVKF